jgi:hypothetical protein
MTPVERALLLAIARALISLMGWGSASPSERATVRRALADAEKETKL